MEAQHWNETAAHRCVTLRRVQVESRGSVAGLCGLWPQRDSRSPLVPGHWDTPHWCTWCRWITPPPEHASGPDLENNYTQANDCSCHMFHCLQWFLNQWAFWVTLSAEYQTYVLTSVSAGGVLSLLRKTHRISQRNTTDNSFTADTNTEMVKGDTAKCSDIV